jgi:anti-sigma factor RsiW
MASDQPISEDDLHAYVDGDIEPVRRLDIALYLARHPDEAARMEVFRAQREAIHALFDDCLHQPVPRRLRSIVRGHAKRRARRRRGTGMLVGIAVAAIVLVTGRTIIQHAGIDHDGVANSSSQNAPPPVGEMPVIRPLQPMPQHDRNFDI